MRVLIGCLVVWAIAGSALAETFRYEVEGASLEVDGGLYGCDRSEKGTLRHPYPGLFDDPAGLQVLVRELAMMRYAECGLVNFLELRLYGTEHVSEIEVLASDYWTLPDLRRPADLDAAEQAAAAERLAQIMATPPPDSHGLSHRGWARAELLHQEEAFRLYAGFASATDDRSELVMVFTDTGGEFFPTALQQREQYNITVVPGPEYYAMLDRALLAAGPPFWRDQLIQHYLDGYYEPITDREATLAKDGVRETALYRMNYGRYWDGSAMRVTPIPMLDLGYENAPEELLIDRERLEVRFGPSDPGPDGQTRATVAALPQAPGDGFLSEGPSPKRRLQRRVVRDGAIEKGLLFLNDGFWAQFASSDVQRIFESHSDYITVGDPGFSAILLNFLDRHGTACGQTIQNPVQWSLKEITVRTDGFGNASRDENVIWDMTVPARFAPLLEEKFNADSSLEQNLGAALDAMRPGGLARAAGDLARDRREVEQSVADVERIMALGDCGNAFLIQFGDMLYHHLAELNPEDHSTLSFPEGDRVVMDYYEPGSTSRLKTACIAAGDFRGNRDDWQFCSCVEAQMERNRPDLVEVYAKRYQRLFSDVKAIRENPDRSADEVLLANSWYSCVGQ